MVWLNLEGLTRTFSSNPQSKERLMTTVGDQIFTLTKQVETLEQQCQRFKEALRAIVTENPCPTTDPHNCPTCLAKEALANAHLMMPVSRSSP
jgi:hypothetical protein